MSGVQKAVELSVASTGIRLINYFIDAVGVVIFFLALGFFLGIFGAFGIIELFETEFIGNLLSLVVYVFYYFLIEWISGGRSFGKWITATRVVKENGDEKLGAKDFIVRSLVRIIPFEPLSFLFSRYGWHDSISGTRVVNIREFRENKFKFDAINQIGEHEDSQNI